jgi:PAS domain S-box-containing protein
MNTQNASMDLERQIEEAMADSTRLLALQTTGLLDSAPLPEFDRLTQIAVKVVGVPAAFVSLVDAQRDFYLSQCGFPEPLASSRVLEGRTFCHHSLLSPDPLVINDATESALFRDVPTARSLGVKAYLGVPLCTDAGEHLGSFCLIDFKPRIWSATEVDLVAELAHGALREIALQKKVALQGGQLQHTQAQLQTVIDALPSMVGYWNRQLHNEFANKAYSEFFNCDPEALAGHHVRELLGDQLFAANWPYMERALAGEWISFQRDIPAKNGTGMRHSLAHYIPDINNGEVQGFFALVHDVSPIKQIQEATERVSRTLRLVKDVNIAVAKAESHQQLLDGICELACKDAGYLLAWVGFAQDDLDKSMRTVACAGKGLDYLADTLVSWDAASPRGSGPTGRAIRSGKAQVINDIAQDPDMLPWAPAAIEQGFASCIAIPFRKKSGVRGCLTIYAAKTDAFAPDEVTLLEELTTNLAAGLDAQAELQRRVAAESATQAKTDFLANMSHEIRTPLNAITGLGYLIRKDGLTPVQNERMAQLETASRHLLSLITDILDLSKIDSGKLSLEQAPLQLDLIVSNVAAMLYDRASAKNLTLQTQVDASGEGLVGDATRIQQALLNYAANAVKFTDSGRIKMRVILLEQSEDHAWVRFEVSDTGIGISEEAQGRLFEAFEQADNANTRKNGGTGLGLAITKKLAELMGGKAGMSSMRGAGSTFWFTARLKRLAAPASLVVAPEFTSLALLQRKLAGKKVLLVEDEPINCELGRIYLEDVGMLVDVAEDGLQAVALANLNQYSVILMDMRMPHMDGLEATRQIRKIPQYQDVPIIAMTANAFVEDKQQCLAAGMNDFITKPAPASEVYAAICRHL